MTTYAKQSDVIKPPTLGKDDFLINYDEKKIENLIHKIIKGKIVKKLTPKQVITYDRKTEKKEQDEITVQEIINFMNQDVCIDKYEYVLFEKLKNYFRNNPSLEYHRFGTKRHSLITKLNLDIYENSKVLKECSNQQYSELIKELFLYNINYFLNNPEELSISQKFINFVLGNPTTLLSRSQIDFLGNTLKCVREKTKMDDNVFFEYYLNMYKKMNPYFEFNYTEVKSVEENTYYMSVQEYERKKEREELVDIEDSDFLDVIHI